MNCVNCSLDNLINYIVNKYNINRKTAIAVYYKLRNQVKNKLFCETDECNRKILKTFIKNNRLYKFFNNLSNCYLDLIIDNVLESCGIDISEPEPEPILGLRLTYLNGEFPETDLVGWNAKFDLPSFGTAFTDMVVNGDEVTLIGGAGITLKSSLFRNDSKLVKIEDDVDCVIAINGGKNAGALSLCSQLTTVTLNGVTIVNQEGLFTNAALASLSMDALTTANSNAFDSCTSLVTINLPALTTAGGQVFKSLTSATTVILPLLSSAGNSCFSNCTSVITFSLPSLTLADDNCFLNCTSATTFNIVLCTTIGNNCFNNCTNATTFNLNSCTDLGGTVGDDSVFLNIIGNTVVVTIPIAMKTANGPLPDIDLVNLAGMNTATINYI